MKNAQATQVFVYLLALIIFASILLYGYRAISKFNEQADEINKLQLTKEIEKAISKTAKDFGSIIKQEIRIASSFQHVCFVDRENAPIDRAACQAAMGADYYAAVCDSWTSNTQENMFLIKNDAEMESLHIGDITIPDPHYVCVNVDRGTIVLRLEGVGGKTQLTEWT